MVFQEFSSYQYMNIKYEPSLTLDQTLSRKVGFSKSENGDASGFV